MHLRHVTETRVKPLEVKTADVRAVEQNAIYMHISKHIYICKHVANSILACIPAYICA